MHRELTTVSGGKLLVMKRRRNLDRQGREGASRLDPTARSNADHVVTNVSDAALDPVFANDSRVRLQIRNPAELGGAVSPPYALAAMWVARAVPRPFAPSTRARASPR